MNYLSSLKWLRLMHSSALLITGGCSATYSVQELEGIKMSQRSVIPQDLPICLIASSILAGASYSACNMSNAAAQQPFARSRLSVGSHFKLAAANSVTTRQNQQSVCHQVILNAKKKNYTKLLRTTIEIYVTSSQTFAIFSFLTFRNNENPICNVNTLVSKGSLPAPTHVTSKVIKSMI